MDGFPVLSENNQGPSDSSLFVTDWPSHLEGRYRRLVLVSHYEQAEKLGIPGDGVLIVTSDWLGWRRMADEGRHALHYEGALADWPAERGDPGRFYIDAGRWMVADGQDVTLFRGVSLGKQFTGHVPLLRHAALRLWHALDRLCVRFGPEELEFRDIRVEYDFLDPGARREIAEDVAGKNGIRFENAADPAPPVPYTFPVSGFPGRSAAEPRLKGWLRNAYGLAVELVSRIRDAGSARRPKVFVLLNWLGVKNMVEGLDTDEVTPVLVAAQWPKTASFVLGCLKRGVVLAAMPGARLDVRDRADLDAITAGVRRILAAPRNVVEKVERDFIFREIIETGWLRERALEVKRYERFFRRWEIRRVLIGDAENMQSRLLIEIGRRQGAPTDELLNGMFLCPIQTDVRCAGPDGLPSLGRLLAWGPQHEKWLELSGGEIGCARSGYPSLGKVAAVADGRVRKRENVLLLPLMADGHEMRGLFANTFSWLVEALRAARAAGYRNVRIRPHPGFPETAAYYRAILDYYGFEGDIRMDGSLVDHLAWSDAVIGPVLSGSFVETLAHGKPHFPLGAAPSSIAPELLGPVRLPANGRELREALESDTGVDREAALSWFCGTDGISDPAGRTWELIAATLRGPGAE